MSAPDMSVVVISHNHGRFLETCLGSLAPERHALALEVWLVDNVCSDATLAVAARFPWVRVLRNQRRLGFAANNNQALRLSTGRQMLLLNPDTEVPAGALDRLAAGLDAHPEAGLCGPQLRFPDGVIQPSPRRFPTPGSVLARRTPLRRWLWRSALNARHLMQDQDLTQTQTVDWLLGACLLVPRRFLQTVGLLDEGYFLYVEDIDWAYRARQAGWQVLYYPEARIVHHHLALSDRRLFSRVSWWHTQSMWRYYRKHLAPAWLRLRVEPERLP
ncbi:MAG: glycosyltransferase family 2 protein [Anaerolineales bacterium]|nr:glycosyltransferase family 2 protein [Anaerolineales bacterium]